MNTFITSLIESTIILSVFYGVYYTLLTKEKDFWFTRFYLIISSALAIIIPQINIPVLPEGSSGLIAPEYIHNAIRLPEIIILGSGNQNASAGNFLMPKDIILVIYAAGFLLFLVRFLYRTGSLFLFIHHNAERTEKKDFYKVINTGGSIPTSSFFSYIFWDETSELNASEKEQVLQHEKGHILLGHSFDIIYLELLSIFFWFNPFIHIYRKEMTTIHEYQADEYALRKNPSRPYLRLLGRQVMLSYKLSLNNHFSKSRTIKRMKMIQKIKNKPAFYKWSISLTTLGLMIYFFSCQTPDDFNNINTGAADFPELSSIKIITPDRIGTDSYKKAILQWLQDNPDEKTVLISSETPLKTIKELANIRDWKIQSSYVYRKGDHPVLYALASHSPGYINADDETAILNTNIEQQKEIYNVVDRQPAPVGGMETFFQYVAKNLRYPEQARNLGIEGRVFVEFVVNDDGSVTSVKTLKGIGAGCDEEAVKVIRNSPKWNPGMKDGKLVNVRLILPITFRLSDEKM